jgi:hypothetical protein
VGFENIANGRPGLQVNSANNPEAHFRTAGAYEIVVTPDRGCEFRFPYRPE